MNGPEFLLFYFLIEVLLIVLGHWMMQKISAGKKHDQLYNENIPSQDILPIAFLAGGIHQAVYTALFRMQLIKALEFDNSSKKLFIGNISRSHITDETERLLFDVIKKNDNPSALRTIEMVRILTDIMFKHFFFQQNPGFLFKHSEKTIWIRRVVLILIFGIAIARIAYGISAGMHKFIFLILLCLIGLLVAYAKLMPPLMTKAAKDYILHLKTLNPKPSQTFFDIATNQQKVLYVALYGEEILRYLGWNNFHDSYMGITYQKPKHIGRSSSQKRFSSSDTNCSSSGSSDPGFWSWSFGGDSTSSSSCSGGDSSCGGGCGGCGGGGD